MLITNATLITWSEPNQVLEGQALYLENGRIAEIGPEADIIASHPQAERLDAGGQYVMPGNICAHTHFYGAFARGMAIPGPAPKDFPEILQKLWWPLDKALRPEDVRVFCAGDAGGCNPAWDHHSHRSPCLTKRDRWIIGPDR